VGVFDHAAIIFEAHIGHFAILVACHHIALKQSVVLVRRDGGHLVGREVGVHVDQAPLGAARPETRHLDPHRNAGATALAGWPIGEDMAAPETGLGQQRVERGRILSLDTGHQLAFQPVREVGTRVLPQDVEHPLTRYIV
jgi:hypothetical protein